MKTAKYIKTIKVNNKKICIFECTETGYVFGVDLNYLEETFPDDCDSNFVANLFNPDSEEIYLDFTK